MKRASWSLCLLALVALQARGQEFKFDPSEFETKTFELTGYVEPKAERFRLNPDGAFYKLAFFDRPQREAIDRGTLTLKPSAKLRLGESTTANLRAHLEAQRDNLDSSRTKRFDEAYLSHKPSPGWTLDAGKVAMKWGKAYAWNPVGFVERPKDPNDPELAREGFSVLAADLIRNFDGPLQTAAFTPVILPVSSDVNGDFGESGHVNIAAKLYLLYHDTDIDFLFLGGGSRTRRYGFDFSRNLGSNLELHGEWARVRDVSRPITDAQGSISSEERDAVSYVAGARRSSTCRATSNAPTRKR